MAGRGVPNPTPALRTGDRVLVRLPAAGDRDELVDLWRRSARHMRPWSPRPPRGAAEKDRDPLARMLRLNRLPSERRMLLCRRADGVILGGISLSNIVRGPLNSCTLGYWLGVDFEGHGFMSEGLPLAFDHAFLDLKLHRVEANIRPENRRSLTLVKRLGMRLEGLALRYLQIDGAYRDHERWAMLADEWRARRLSREGRPGSG